MGPSRRRVPLVAMVVLAAIVGFTTARRRTGVTPDNAVAEGAAGSTSPAPLTVDLSGAPIPRRVGSSKEPDWPSTAAPRGPRRVHVKLPDGTDAPSGTVLWAEAIGVGSGSPALLEELAFAAIGANGVAELDDVRPEWGGGGTLCVAVPEWPSSARYMYVNSLDDAVDVVLPEGVPFSGRVVDSIGRGVSDLPILLTGRTVSPYAVFDEDIEFKTRVLGSTGANIDHVEAVTDSAGRFRVKVSKIRAQLRDGYRVVSRDSRWFVRSLDRFPISDDVLGRDIGDVVASPGVALDLRTIARDGSALDFASISIFSTEAAGPWSFGASIRFTTTHVRMPRLELDRDVPITVVLAARDFSPVVARTTVPLGLVETRVDLTLDRADDESRTGLAELSIPLTYGVAGHDTPWSLELQTVEEPRIRVDIRDRTQWSAVGRIDARLPPGSWHLRLLPRARDRAAFEADVTVAARVTTRVTMKP